MSVADGTTATLVDEADGELITMPVDVGSMAVFDAGGDVAVIGLGGVDSSEIVNGALHARIERIARIAKAILDFIASPDRIGLLSYTFSHKKRID